MACFQILSWEVLADVVILMGPLWIISMLFGVLVGLMWRPNLTSLFRNQDSAKTISLSLTKLGFLSNFGSVKIPLSVYMPWISDDGFGTNNSSGDTTKDFNSMSVNAHSEKIDLVSSIKADIKKMDLVGDDDIQHLCRLVEEKDSGPAWTSFYKNSTPTMTYEAWRRDPKSGPFQCRSKTVFEDVTPELVRDFFWDDEFRNKWDDMLIHSSTLEECPVTGAMLVHWIRKFPLFLSNREYTIARRIWESGKSYYCVTKAVPCSTIPRSKKPWRVDLYYSSWFIRPVESMRGDRQITATEVTLFHHEDVGIPVELAKLGMKKGMWLVVKKIEPGLRAYQEHRASSSSISRSAFMAQINTKVCLDFLNSSENFSNENSSNKKSFDVSLERSNCDLKSPEVNKRISKFLIVGGALVVACSLDRALLTKALLLGAARRLARKESI